MSKEINRELIESFIGKEIVIYCCRYIYAGTVVALDDISLQLTDCGIVYDTGPHSALEWANFEKLACDHCLMFQSIEGFGKFKEKKA